MNTATRVTRGPEIAAPIHELLASRWSPRGFDPEASVTKNQLDALLEAARWAPSASNQQPWRFIVVRRGSAGFAKVIDHLVGFNQEWAPNASVFVVAIAATRDADGAIQRWAEYDLGQSVAHLTLQAEALGLITHQMGGFDAAGLQGAFALAEDLVPVAIVAVGTVIPAEQIANEGIRERETAPRVRRELSESILLFEE